MTGIRHGSRATGAEPEKARRRTTAEKLLIVLAAASAVLVVPGCAEEKGSPAGPGGTDYAAAALKDPSLPGFIDNCAKHIDAYRPAQIAWPRTMQITLGDTTSYTITVDARAIPAPIEQLDKTVVVAGKNVAIKCAMGTQLKAMNASALTVEADGTDADGWIWENLDKSGVLQFSWSVKANTIGNQELRLAMKPVVSADSVPVGPSAVVRYETTRVLVTGGPLDKAWHWINTDGRVLRDILVTLVGAYLALLALFEKVRTGTVNAFKAAAPKSRRRKTRAVTGPKPDPKPSSTGSSSTVRPPAATDTGGATNRDSSSR